MGGREGSKDGVEGGEGMGRGEMEGGRDKRKSEG